MNPLSKSDPPANVAAAKKPAGGWVNPGQFRRGCLPGGRTSNPEPPGLVIGSYKHRLTSASSCVRDDRGVEATGFPDAQPAYVNPRRCTPSRILLDLLIVPSVPVGDLHRLRRKWLFLGCFPFGRRPAECWNRKMLFTPPRTSRRASRSLYPISHPIGRCVVQLPYSHWNPSGRGSNVARETLRDAVTTRIFCGRPSRIISGGRLSAGGDFVLRRASSATVLTFITLALVRELGDLAAAKHPTLGRDAGEALRQPPSRYGQYHTLVRLTQPWSNRCIGKLGLSSGVTFETRPCQTPDFYRLYSAWDTMPQAQGWISSVPAQSQGSHSGVGAVAESTIEMRM